MNKSVLIVICDFVVLSMMTLIIGLSGPQQGVGGTGRSTSDIAASSVLLEAVLNWRGRVRSWKSSAASVN